MNRLKLGIPKGSLQMLRSTFFARRVRDHKWAREVTFHD